MYELLLRMLVEKKYNVEIKGITGAGTEKVLNVLEGTSADSSSYMFVQDSRTGRCIFTSSMVSCILFHEFGCTITLKH